MKIKTVCLVVGNPKTEKILASLANTSHRIQKKGRELIVDVYTY